MKIQVVNEFDRFDAFATVCDTNILYNSSVPLEFDFAVGICDDLTPLAMLLNGSFLSLVKVGTSLPRINSMHYVLPQCFKIPFVSIYALLYSFYYCLIKTLSV